MQVWEPHIFYSERNEQINQHAAAFCQNVCLVDYKKTGSSVVAAKAGKAFFTDFHVLAFKLDSYTQ